MPRVNTVKRARKAQGTCGRCGTEIKAGDAYVWIKFRHGGKRTRCADPKCRFRASDLTQSKMASVYAAQESIEDNLGDCETIEDVKNLCEEVTTTIREVGEEYQASADAITEHFEGSSTAEECETKAQELEAWADEIESAVEDFEDFEPVNGYNTEGERVCPDCGSDILIDEDDDPPYFICCDVVGCGAHGEVDASEDEPRDDEGRNAEEYVAAAREALESAASSCPC